MPITAAYVNYTILTTDMGRGIMMGLNRSLFAMKFGDWTSRNYS